MIRLPRDDRLRAEVRRRVPLVYPEGPDPALDRPPHARAASSISRVGSRLLIVQDDAAFLARLGPAGEPEAAVPLPAGADGVRTWDEARGTKHLKPDLEASIALPGMLIAFGSGSTPARERILVVEEPGEPRWVAAHALYALLRRERAFSGSELNVEGAARVGSAVRLFNRGNGAPAGGLLPVDATCDLELDRLVAYLRGRAGAPAPRGVVQYELGEVGGARLTFTGAAEAADGVLFTAAAEASPDSYRDGPVAGSAIGWLGGEAGGWAPLQEGGEPFPGKAEGLVPDADDPTRLLVVVDRDDPRLPAELCEVRLAGPWP